MSNDSFRKAYRPLSPEEQEALYRLKLKADELNTHLKILPAGHERCQAMTKLEEAVMWAVKAATA